MPTPARGVAVDTPGHPDFIAEVERSLGVLDGVVLVVSAVEGVQAQTRVLMRAVRRLGLPTVLFVNKADRGGADPERVLAEISAKLTPAAFPLGRIVGAGTREACFVSDVPELRRLGLWSQMAADSRRGTVHPVFFGSAITGAGVPELMAGIEELLPRSAASDSAKTAGRVFKVERGAAGDRIAYVRMFEAEEAYFAPPTLETVVEPREQADRGPMFAALTQLSEQDPLIGLRYDKARAETSLSLYDEVRLGGPGRGGDADPQRILGPAKPLARHLRQEHVEHGRRLPDADSAGAHRSAGGSRDRGLRTDAPVPARRAGLFAGSDSGLTGGEGVLESAFDHFAPVTGGEVPERARWDANPLDRKEYLMRVQRGV